MSVERPRFRRDLVPAIHEVDGIRVVDVTDPRRNTTFRFFDYEYSVALAFDGRPLAKVIPWVRITAGLELTVDQLSIFAQELEALGFLEAEAVAAAPQAHKPVAYLPIPEFVDVPIEPTPTVVEVVPPTEARPDRRTTPVTPMAVAPEPAPEPTPAPAPHRLTPAFPMPAVEKPTPVKPRSKVDTLRPGLFWAGHRESKRDQPAPEKTPPLMTSPPVQSQGPAVTLPLFGGTEKKLDPATTALGFAPQPPLASDESSPGAALPQALASSEDSFTSSLESWAAKFPTAPEPAPATAEPEAANSAAEPNQAATPRPDVAPAADEEWGAAPQTLMEGHTPAIAVPFASDAERLPEPSRDAEERTEAVENASPPLPEATVDASLSPAESGALSGDEPAQPKGAAEVFPRAAAEWSGPVEPAAADRMFPEATPPAELTSPISPPVAEATPAELTSPISPPVAEATPSALTSEGDAASWAAPDEPAVEWDDTAEPTEVVAPAGAEAASVHDESVPWVAPAPEEPVAEAISQTAAPGPEEVLALSEDLASAPVSAPAEVPGVPAVEAEAPAPGVPAVEAEAAAPGVPAVEAEAPAEASTPGVPAVEAEALAEAPAPGVPAVEAEALAEAPASGVPAVEAEALAEAPAPGVPAVEAEALAEAAASGVPAVEAEASAEAPRTPETEASIAPLLDELAAIPPAAEAPPRVDELASAGDESATPGFEAVVPSVPAEEPSAIENCQEASAMTSAEEPSATEDSPDSHETAAMASAEDPFTPAIEISPPVHEPAIEEAAESIADEAPPAERAVEWSTEPKATPPAQEAQGTPIEERFADLDFEESGPVVSPDLAPEAEPVSAASPIEERAPEAEEKPTATPEAGAPELDAGAEVAANAAPVQASKPAACEDGTTAPPAALSALPIEERFADLDFEESGPVSLALPIAEAASTAVADAALVEPSSFAAAPARDDQAVSSGTPARDDQAVSSGAADADVEPVPPAVVPALDALSSGAADPPEPDLLEATEAQPAPPTAPAAGASEWAELAAPTLEGEQVAAPAEPEPSFDHTNALVAERYDQPEAPAEPDGLDIPALESAALEAVPVASDVDAPAAAEPGERAEDRAGPEANVVSDAAPLVLSGESVSVHELAQPASASDDLPMGPAADDGGAAQAESLTESSVAAALAAFAETSIEADAASEWGDEAPTVSGDDTKDAPIAWADVAMGEDGVQEGSAAHESARASAEMDEAREEADLLPPHAEVALAREPEATVPTPITTSVEPEAATYATSEAIETREPEDTVPQASAAAASGAADETGATEIIGEASFAEAAPSAALSFALAAEEAPLAEAAPSAAESAAQSLAPSAEETPLAEGAPSAAESAAQSLAPSAEETPLAEAAPSAAEFAAQSLAPSAEETPLAEAAPSAAEPAAQSLALFAEETSLDEGAPSAAESAAQSLALAAEETPFAEAAQSAAESPAQSFALAAEEPPLAEAAPSVAESAAQSFALAAEESPLVEAPSAAASAVQSPALAELAVGETLPFGRPSETAPSAYVSSHERPTPTRQAAVPPEAFADLPVPVERAVAEAPITASPAHAVPTVSPEPSGDMRPKELLAFLEGATRERLPPDPVVTDPSAVLEVRRSSRRPVYRPTPTPLRSAPLHTPGVALRVPAGRRWALLGYALLGVACAAVLGVVGLPWVFAARQPEGIRVRTLVPEPGPVYRWFETSAPLERAELQTLEFPVGGKVTRVAEPGSVVAAGDVLATVDAARPLQAELARQQERQNNYRQLAEKARAAGQVEQAREAEAKLEQASGFVRQALAAIARVAVVAPGPGQVESVLAAVGQTAQPGAPAVRVRPAGWRARFELPRAQAAQARHVGFCRLEVEGKLLDCVLQPDPVDDLHVQAELDGIDPALTGKSARLARLRYESVLVLPSGAVSRVGSTDRVWVALPNQRVESRAVLVAEQSPGGAIVTQGLDPGEAVIVDPPAGLSASSLIQPIRTP